MFKGIYMPFISRLIVFTCSYIKMYLYEAYIPFHGDLNSLAYKDTEPYLEAYYMEIKFRIIKEQQVAYIITTGNYDQIPKIFNELMDYTTKNNIHTLEHPYCTFFNNTLEVPPEELHYEIGIPVTGDISGEGKIKIKKIHGHNVISTIYKGSPKYTDQLYHNLMECAVEKGYLIAGPVTEIYRDNNPMEALKSDLEIEVRFPVIKK